MKKKTPEQYADELVDAIPLTRALAMLELGNASRLVAYKKQPNPNQMLALLRMHLGRVPSEDEELAFRMRWRERYLMRCEAAVTGIEPQPTKRGGT